MTFRAAVDKIEKRGNDSAPEMPVEPLGGGVGGCLWRRRWLSLVATVPAADGADSGGSLLG